MSYNLKIIHTNSYLEIYEYDSLIYSGYKSENENGSVKKKRNFEEITDEEQLQRLKRMAKQRQNSKWELMRLIDSNFDNKTSFLTLTTKENIKSREMFNQMFDKFITRFNYHFLHTKKRALKYIAVLEKQERGAYHAHIILFDIGFLEQKELTEVWGNGFVWINKLDNLDDSSNAGRYVAKYMEKAIGQELLESKGKKAYYSSRNLKKPKIEKYFGKENLTDLKYKESDILYENEYIAQFYKNGSYVEGTVRYRKIKARKGDKDV